MESLAGNSFPVDVSSLNLPQMPRKAPAIDPDQAIPEASSMDRPVTPRPREAKLVQILASGDASTVSQAMMQAGINPHSTSIRRRLAEGGDLRQQLDEALEAAGLTLPRVLQKLNAKMDATRIISVDKKAIETEDNDAQLRATEQVIKLHDRAGTLPSAQEGSGSSNITVNVLVMGEKSET